ncbi:MAG: rhodanese-like domain-containing protein [Flavobacteriaceae bacterium]|nr:rhodanese-like domain-containing protein [Flavobacteriaceae bacterium]
MKRFNFKIVLLLIVSISLTSCAQGSSAKKSNVVSLITPQELNEKLGNIQLIDVRTPQEFAEGHIDNAKMIDYMQSDFMNKMSKLDTSKVLYIYCRSGNRSGKAARKLEAMGFPKIYDLKGGILNWNQSKMKVIK